jgi:RNA polymerase sigma-70 factor, ECF subfamily
MDVLDPELVRQAQGGNRAARERLLGALQPVLRGFFYKRIGNRIEIDDLVQNTLLRVHSSLDDLQQADRLKAFAMKAAMFELQDLYRGRYSAKETLYDPDRPPSDPAARDSAGLRMDLERALEVLTPKARRIVELREMGYQYDEIAEMVETTEAAVKMQVKRAFERLRGMLSAVALVLWGILPGFSA